MKDFSLFIKQCYHIVWSVEKIQKVIQYSLKLADTVDAKKTVR